MKIVQVSGYDLLGIQVNGYLLHEHYRHRGHSSKMFVHAKSSSDPDVVGLERRYLSYLNLRLRQLGELLSLWSILPVEAYPLLFNRDVRRADIVHLQLTYNAQFFSLFLIAMLSWLRWRKPTLVSIHDMFMTTGHCVYSIGCERWTTGCGKCPGKDIPFPIRHDTTRLSWWIRRIVFALARVQLIAGSPWQLRMIARSPILARLPVHYVPYGVDTRNYRLKDKSLSRSRFGIPDEAHVVSFRSVPVGFNFKGTEFVISALQAYEPKKETYLLTFEGVGGLECLSDKYKVIQLPWTNDDQELLADALNSADIFLMCSIAEAFGLMAIEALACGTPVIVFDGTALPETIDAPNCGLAVPMKDMEGLEKAISMLLSDDELQARMARNGLDLVKRKHRLETYGDKYLELYEELLKN